MKIPHEVLHAAKQLGVKVECISNKKLECGDMYIAHRNGNVKVLTCKVDDRENGWVIPVENEYLFDTNECFRIVNDEKEPT